MEELLAFLVFVFIITVGVLVYLVNEIKNIVKISSNSAVTFANTAATRVELVKIALEDRTSSTDQKLESIHILVNSAMGLQLKLYAVAARRIAELPDANDADKQAAELADKNLAEHEKQQAIVDKK